MFIVIGGIVAVNVMLVRACRKFSQDSARSSKREWRFPLVPRLAINNREYLLLLLT